MEQIEKIALGHAEAIKRLNEQIKAMAVRHAEEIQRKTEERNELVESVQYKVAQSLENLPVFAARCTTYRTKRPYNRCGCTMVLIGSVERSRDGELGCGGCGSTVKIDGDNFRKVDNFERFKSLIQELQSDR